MKPFNTVVGNDELCAWQPVYGVTWVQTRSPKIAHKLSRRQDSKLVAVGVAGGYLRTFEFQKKLGWAARLIARYQASGTVTNDTLNGSVARNGGFLS